LYNHPKTSFGGIAAKNKKKIKKKIKILGIFRKRPLVPSSMSCRSLDQGPVHQPGIKKQKKKQHFFSHPDLAFRAQCFPGGSSGKEEARSNATQMFRPFRARNDCKTRIKMKTTLKSKCCYVQ
jgi:hypothetical protein